MRKVFDESDAKYQPKTARATELVQRVQHYQELFAAAKAASDALALWAADFVSVLPGMVIDAGKRLNTPCAVYIPTFEMRGRFTGWGSNKHRMRVDEVHIVKDHGLSFDPQLKVHLTGVPLKDTGEPFKDARCSVTLDILEYAMDREPDAETGYPGYFCDALARYVDHVEEKVQDAPKASDGPGI